MHEKWHRTENGFIRERDGKIEKHSSIYLSHDRFTLRADYDEEGRCTGVAPYQTESYLVVDAEGEIVAFSGIGFDLRLALGDPIDLPPGHEMVRIPAMESCAHCGHERCRSMAELLPADFEVDVPTEAVYVDDAGTEVRREQITARRFAYRWDRKKGELVRKLDGELNTPVRRRAR